MPHFKCFSPSRYQRQTLVDEFSTFKLNTASTKYSSAGPENDKSRALIGLWRGSCNPRVPANGPNCRVTLNVQQHGMFELQISGCSGWGIPMLAQGILSEDGITKVLTSERFGFQLGVYRRFKIHHASGRPAASTLDSLSGMVRTNGQIL